MQCRTEPATNLVAYCPEHYVNDYHCNEYRNGPQS